MPSLGAGFQWTSLHYFLKFNTGLVLALSFRVIVMGKASVG